MRALRGMVCALSALGAISSCGRAAEPPTATSDAFAIGERSETVNGDAQDGRADAAGADPGADPGADAAMADANADGNATACYQPPPCDFRGGSCPSVLSVVRVASCRDLGPERGTGHVTVTIEPSGEITSARIDSGRPFAGTRVGACIEARYLALRLCPFAGERVRTGKSFALN